MKQLEKINIVQEARIEHLKSPYTALRGDIEYIPLSIDEFVSAMKLRKEWFVQNVEEHLRAFDVEHEVTEIIIRAKVKL